MEDRVTQDEKFLQDDQRNFTEDKRTLDAEVIHSTSEGNILLPLLILSRAVTRKCIIR